MLVEFAIKIGDSRGERRKYTDGMPMDWKPVGVHWAASEVNSHLALGTPLPEWGTLSLTQQNRLTRRFAELKQCNDPNVDPAQIARLMFGLGRGTPSEEQVQDALHRISLDVEVLAQIQLVGLDTNWGFVDRKHYGIGLMLLDPRDLDDFCEEEFDPVPFEDRQAIRSRAYRIPYEQLLSTESKEQWQDRNHTQIVDRSVTPWTRAEVRERIQDER